MDYIILFLISFLIVYLAYYLIIVRRDKGIEAFKKGKQVLFFKNAYKLNLRKLDYKKFANNLSLVNAFIIAFTVTVIEMVSVSLPLKLLISIVILIPLMLICYYILGRVYKKKEGK